MPESYRISDFVEAHSLSSARDHHEEKEQHPDSPEIPHESPHRWVA
jgi:hypothetical protein